MGASNIKAFTGCCSNSTCKKENSEFNQESDDIRLQRQKESTRLKVIEPGKTQILTLRVVNSLTLPKDTQIQINYLGVVGAHRSKKDGISYFGAKKRSKKMPNGEKVIHSSRVKS